MGVAQKRLRSIADPFHRPSRHLGAPQHQRDFVVDLGFHAEAAADIASNHSDFTLWYLKDLASQVTTIGMSLLQRCVNRIVILGDVVVPDGAARLHGGGGHPIDKESFANYIIGHLEGRISRFLVTAKMDKANVVWAIIPYQGCAGLRSICGRGNMRQRLVLDID